MIERVGSSDHPDKNQTFNQQGTMYAMTLYAPLQRLERYFKAFLWFSAVGFQGQCPKFNFI
jgi:hypothetical protein